jgi:hypothetical protein
MKELVFLYTKETKWVKIYLDELYNEVHRQTSVWYPSFSE